MPARLELARRRRLSVDPDAAREEWKRYRRSNDRLPVLTELARMAGIRGRCFYCSDSLAADVEHYVPIAADFAATFHWRNLLWVCPNCNRKKVAQFPTDEQGQPLILNPAEDEPWDHLVLVSETGLLAPRYGDEGNLDRRGVATLEVLDILTYEAGNEGRVRTVRRLRRAAERVLDSDGSPDAMRGFLREVREDDHGVASWFALREGQDEQPFASIKRRLPGAWRRFVGVVVTQQQGTSS